jgi:hypothetical protein
MISEPDNTDNSNPRLKAAFLEVAAADPGF